MRTRFHSLLGLAMLATAAVLAACGDAGSTPPTAEQLATRLVTTTSFDGAWMIERGPDDGSDMTSGVIPEDQRELLPSIELCDDATAEARAAADSLSWSAFRQMNLDVDDPINPPNDRSGHMVFVQQFLTSGDASELATTFELLHSGSEACFGAIPAGDEGPGTAEAMAVPAVGDERFGVLTTMGEAGGWAEWRLHSFFVRDGDVLMSFVVVDIRAGEGVEPYFTTDDLDRMITIAADFS